MKSWRLNWFWSEISMLSNYRKHHALLHSSWKFWVVLVFKLVPHAWPFAFHLRLRDGGEFVVRRFMTLFVYDEIFADRCYEFDCPLPPEPVIFDVGANTGLFILRMKQLYPAATLIGFEPAPANFSELELNIRLSLLEDVVVRQCGVAGNSGKAKLYLHHRNLGGNSIYKEEAGGSSDYCQIDLVSVEQMLECSETKTCDLLKLDCEGAEFEILMAIDEAIATNIKNIVFEPTWGRYDLKELLRHLERIGYRIGKTNGGLYFATYSGLQVRADPA